MYERLKRLVLPLLRVEDATPAPLPGQTGDASVQVVRACPSYLRYRLFFWKLYALAWAAAVLVVSGALLALDWRFLFLVIPLAGVSVAKAAVLYVAARLDYEMRWYVLTDRSLLIRQGVWVVREICITFANAQNVSVHQGPLERWFGFSNLEVDTAGGGKKEEPGSQTHRAALRGLRDPEPVRLLILDLLKRYRAAGLGDPDDDPERSILRSEHSPALLRDIWMEAKRLRAVLEGEAA